MDKYNIVERINLKGNVYLVHDKNNVYYVMKIIPYEKNEFEQICLKKVKDICDTKIICYIEDFIVNVDNSQYKVLILEYDKNYIDLMEFIKNYKITKDDMKKIYKQIEKILNSLHERNVLHGAVNERNVMINPDNLYVKLIDFGNCKIVSDNNFQQDILQFNYLKVYLKNYFI